MAAPDEPDVAVSGGDTPSGGALRRLLSRDGSSLFGARTNGSLAPPLSVPVDPLLAGPPMDAAYLEREALDTDVSGNGHGDSDHDGTRGSDNAPSGNGAAVDVADGWADERTAEPDVGNEIADDAHDAEAVDDRAFVDAEVLFADETDDAAFGETGSDAFGDGLDGLEGGAEASVDARTAPSPLIEPYPTVPASTDLVDLVDPPATVAVPALMPGPEVPRVDAPTERTTVPPPPRRRRTRPRVRKVTRIVRYIDAWSVFKVALLLNVVVAAVMVTASVLLWNLANSTDVVDNIEGVVEDWLAYETFTFDGQAMFRAVLVLAGMFVIGATGLAVLAATLFNLISDLTGGVRVTVLEREVMASMPPSARKVRGGAARRAAARRAADAQASVGQTVASYPTHGGSG